MTDDNLIRLEIFIGNGFIRKQHIVAIFFDLDKAYDTTWRYGIVKDLHNIGLRGHFIDFIQKFLSNRSFLAGLSGSVGCAVRLETRKTRVQPPPKSATFFRGD